MPLLNNWTPHDLTSTCLLSHTHFLPCLQTQQHSTLVQQVMLSSPDPAFAQALLSLLPIYVPTYNCTYHKSIYFLSVLSSQSEDKKFMNHLKLHQKCTWNPLIPHY